jgi:hypothetical protein
MDYRIMYGAVAHEATFRRAVCRLQSSLTALTSPTTPFHCLDACGLETGRSNLRMPQATTAI